ncbi:MAG: hypothetical protein LVQ95_02450 [Candidatus Micrarchaeales archaeon]|nr:hypothetical protein [Candidatus Micrarchaeales archaeon]
MLDAFAILLQAGAYNSSVVAQTYVTADSIYTENTLTVLLMILTVLAISVQIARGYFLRILRKFTLRLAADLWWLIFILLRDASIFLIVFLGVSLFWPGTYHDYPIAVPFQPLAIDFFAFALVLMLIKDTDEDPKYNAILTYLVLIGTMLYIFGTVFITESAVVLNPLPPTVSMSTGNFWGFLYTYFNSQNNPTLAIYTFYVTFLLFLGAGGVAIRSSLKNSGAPRSSIATNPKPQVKETAPPQQPAQKAPPPAAPKK